MKVTRKGYYTIECDGVPLEREDGTPVRVTSRDKCYSYIYDDGRSGVFVVRCPDWEIELTHHGTNNGTTITVPTGTLNDPTKKVITVPTGKVIYWNVDDDDGNWIGVPL